MNAIKKKDPLCSSRSVMLYADGELDAPHALEVESHLSQCKGCHEELSTISAMRASVRRSTRRKAPAELEARLVGRLAEALLEEAASRTAVDGASVARGESRTAPSPRRWSAIAFAAAACFVIVAFAIRRDSDRTESSRADGSRATPNERATNATMLALGSALREVSPNGPAGSAAANDSAGPFDALIDQLVAFHAHPLPPDARNPDELTKYEPWVGIPLKRSALTMLRSIGICPTRAEAATGTTQRGEPCLATRAQFVGARIDSRGAAALRYQLQGHRVTIYIFDPKVIPMGRTRLQSRVVRQGPVYVGQLRGFSVAAAEKSGVGYALASDFDEDRSMQMVASF